MEAATWQVSDTQNILERRDRWSSSTTQKGSEAEARVGTAPQREREATRQTSKAPLTPRLRVSSALLLPLRHCCREEDEAPSGAVNPALLLGIPNAKFVDEVTKGLDWYASRSTDTDGLEFARHHQLVNLAPADAEGVGGLLRG